ncbi:hypothetical protein E2C01_076099 [Portunus trituberculatus]|uniref:Uncharacterized protein n=1 Tax=Portunus trituberculatus TaxID=210409 RepID=A0A5B7ICC6_PORTR|nr:hypothetical protein [Portunus trituberculatus]
MLGETLAAADAEDQPASGTETVWHAYAVLSRIQSKYSVTRVYTPGYCASAQRRPAQLPLRDVPVRVAGSAFLVGPHRHCHLQQYRGDRATEVNGAPPL